MTVHSDHLHLTEEQREKIKEEWGNRPLREVVDFILQRYHPQMRHLVRRIDHLIKQLEEESPPAMNQQILSLRHLLAMLVEDHERHTQEEETELFPAIRAMEKAAARPPEERTPAITAGHAFHSLWHIYDEHDQIMDLLVYLKAEAVLGKISQIETTTGVELIETLTILIRDLGEHVFIEDRILFPRAIRLEESLRAGKPPSKP